MTLTDGIQIVAVLAAVFASIMALRIATKDRKIQLEIAARAREHDRLRTQLEYAVRLSANRNMGGSTDPEESERLGSEALALATVVGERWVPLQWSRASDGKTTEELKAMLDLPETELPGWVKDKIETGLAIQAMMDELYKED